MGSRLVSRTERAKALAGEARVERSQIRLPEQADGVRFVIGDVGKRTARKRPLGLDHRVAFEQWRDIGERTAAQDGDDERIRFAFVLPRFGARCSDRRADRLQLIELTGIGGLVALCDPELNPLQLVDEVGHFCRIGERHGRRKEDERRQSQCTAGARHGFASRTRISMRRFSAARGCGGSLR